MPVILRAEGPKDPKLVCGGASLGRSFRAGRLADRRPAPQNKKGGLSAALLTRFSLRLTR